jgi:hypothetical protein
MCGWLLNFATHSPDDRAVTASRQGHGRVAAAQSASRVLAYFRSKSISMVPAGDLIQLTAAPRAGGSRWDAIAATCGVATMTIPPAGIMPGMEAGRLVPAAQ